MGRTVGIDLGTTNSEVAIVENGQARVLPGEDGELILPSCVGFSETGRLLVGREALRQYAAAPERTVRSIKRWMGHEPHAGRQARR
jgi:molecular chaperone DnaK